MKKRYIEKGDYVKFKHKFENTPEKMLVVGLKKDYERTFDGEGKDTKLVDSKQYLVGIKCQWFNKNGTLVEGLFNTKDIVKI